MTTGGNPLVNDTNSVRSRVMFHNFHLLLSCLPFLVYLNCAN